MHFKTLCACLAVLFFSQVSVAAQRDWKVLELPPTLAVKQEIKLTPRGWMALPGDVPHQVSGITVYDGRPEKKASLVPDTEEHPTNRKRLVATWHLMPSTAEGIWLTVSYSATSIVIARQLPLGSTDLRVTYDTSITVDGLSEILSVEYR